MTADGNSGEQRHAPPADARPPAARYEEPVMTPNREMAQVDGHQLVAARLRCLLHPRALVVAPRLLYSDDVGIERLDRGDDIERPAVRAEAGVSVEGGDGE